MRLGAIIKGFREEHSMNIDAFADASGISKSYISVIESGRSDGSVVMPSKAVIQKAAKGMGLQYMELMEMMEEPSPEVADAEQILQSLKTDESLYNVIVTLYSFASKETQQKLTLFFAKEVLLRLDKE